MASKLVISNFKYGLDGRRNELTSQPGTMVQATNGFINQGGEFEKRKAFSLLGTLPTGCYGIQETSSGLFTFGNGAASIATTFRQTVGTTLAILTFATSHGYSVGQTVRIAGVGGASPYNGDYVVSAVTPFTISYHIVGGTSESKFGDSGGTVTFPLNLPTGVSYQRLRHYTFWLPSQSVPIATGGNYSVGDPSTLLAEPAMTGVVYSCSFKGKTVVVATFAGAVLGGVNIPASTLIFYDGNPLVEQSVGISWIGGGLSNGIFLSGQLNIALPGYFGTDFVLNGFTSNDSIFTGPVSQAFAVTVSDANNFTTATVTSPQSSAVTAVAPYFIFYLVAGNTGVLSVLTGPSVANGVISANAVDLLQGATVAYSMSKQITTQNIAAEVNKHTAVTGYSAVAGVDQQTGFAFVKVSGPTSLGALTNAGAALITVTVTLTMKINLVAAIAGDASTFSPVFGTNPVSGAGTTGSAAVGQTEDIGFGGGTWPIGQGVTGASWTGTLVSNDIEYTIGSGNIGGIIPNFCMALGRKLYLLATDTFYFSAINDPTKWEDQDTGSGFVQVSDQFASPTSLVALAAYQGKLAVFSRWNIQVWNINADPAQYSQSQSLQNIGTFAPLSVQSVGDLDVLFLSDTGVRSLRVRDSSLNGYIVDLGSSVDSFIQSDVQALGAGASAACGIVEPLTNNYWLHVNGNIYVLAYYPSLKITAWSKYLPTYETFTSPITGVGSGFTNTFSNLTIGTRYYWIPDAGAINLVCGTTNVSVAGWFIANATTAIVTNHVGSGSFTDTLLLATQTAFTPKKFLIFQGQVYCLDTNGKLFVYGGTNNNTYDSCVATGELPWLDGKTPNIVKKGQRIDAAFQGMWTVEYGLDPKATTPTQVVVPINLGAVGDGGADSTFDESQFSTSGFKGTHHKVLFYTSPNWANVARFSAVTFQYDGGHEA